MTRVLALDLGSSSVRAVVCEADHSDGAGGAPDLRPLPDALARRTVTPRQDDDGTGELDPEAYVASLIECLDELTERDVLHGVERVATSSQWHSVLAVDPAGELRSAALTWLDTRAEPVRTPDDPEAFHARTGAWVHALYWTTKLPWLRDQLGDQLGDRPGDADVRFVGLPDYVRGVLLGDDATSVSVASGTGLLDLAGCAWDDEALSIAGASRAEVPAIDPADQPLRRLAPAWRDRWPALADAGWHPVLGDGAASNLGSGCASSDAVALTVGTSMAMRVVHTDADVAGSELPWQVWRYRVDHRTLVSGIAFSGGGVLHAWVARLLGLDQDAAEPRTVRPGESGLLVVPLHAGSRPPSTVPPGSGGVVGLSLDTTPEEFLAGTMDGVALEAARSLDSLEKLFGGPLQVVLGGGAVAASPWWRQSFAAALDRTVTIASDAEVGARGAAALALEVALPRPTESIRPDPADVTRLSGQRARYARLRGVFDTADMTG